MSKLLLVIPILLVILLGAGCPFSGGSIGLSPKTGFTVDGEVLMKDLYPGYPKHGEDNSFEIRVENRIGEETAKEVRVRIAPEDDKDLGDWEQLPEEYYSWFDVYPLEFRLEPGESQILTIVVSIPEDVDYSGKRARCELLVLPWPVIEVENPDTGEMEEGIGNVPFGVASEWFIEMY